MYKQKKRILKRLIISIRILNNKTFDFFKFVQKIYV